MKKPVKRKALYRNRAMGKTTSQDAENDVPDSENTAKARPGNRKPPASSTQPTNGLTTPSREGIIDLQKTPLPNETTEAISTAAVDAPLSYTLNQPSKGVRGTLIDAINTWLDVQPEQVLAIKDAINRLHAASLILDDIEDRSPLRRGRPAAHIVFGPSQSINSATYAMIRVIQDLSHLGSPQITEVALTELSSLVAGQGWDLYWSFHMTVPTEAEYLRMVDSKTGGLFRMAIRLLLCTADPSSPGTHPLQEPLLLLARSMGRLFQIRDDYMNLMSEQYNAQKGFAEDLDEGKLSYPLITAIHASADDPSIKDQIFGILRSNRRPLLPEAKRFIIDLMEKTGALASAAQKMRDLEGEVTALIHEIERRTGKENTKFRALVQMLRVK